MISEDPEPVKSVWMALRRRKGLSVIEAAESLGVNVTRFILIERLERQPTPEEIDAYVSLTLD